MNPYLGIILDFLLPALFLFGLVLIPIGIFLRRRHLKSVGQLPSIYPKVDFANPAFRSGVIWAAAFTLINFIILGTASYRGVAYMDTPEFCGQLCHVMKPEFTAYQVSAHAHVDCASCHIGSGISSFVAAKVNGTKQLYDVMFNRYPRPVESPVSNLRPAREICEGCHTPAKYIGEKMLVKTSFADDEQNTSTKTVVLLHLGGRDSLSNLSGIHGAHLGHIEYVATDSARSTIPWVQKRNSDGSTTEFASSTAGNGIPKGERRVMDCIDCHNRAAHSMDTPEVALSRAMVEGAVSPSLPYVHKKGMELLKVSYRSEAEARAQIPAQLMAFYRSSYPAVAHDHADTIRAAAEGLVSIYTHNVFPEMKVDWGTHPNNIGHTSYPGCFRCHDGDHTSKGGKTITQDCSVCHNLLAVDEAKPKLLTDLGVQQ
ncbi:NapC/NirT family cytochrome c [Telmatobacter bradus]|uniref:NapC/NirT family cytochrome c n=1 Tax=Telmatobacter bradus TaxID=474953 RepID=UPI003B4304BE